MPRFSLIEQNRCGLLALALALTPLTGCAKSPCEEAPDYPGCKPLEIALLAGRAQAYRNQAGVAVFNVDGLDLRADTYATVTLALDPDPSLTPTPDDCNRDVKGVPNACDPVVGTPSIRQDENTGRTGLQLDGVSARGGFFTLTANRLGPAIPPGPQPILLYTPPNLADAESLVAPVSYPAAMMRTPVSVVMVPAATGSPGSGLFVTEQDGILFDTVLSRYNYAASTAGASLVLDGGFNQAFIVEDRSGFVGRFALSTKSALIYQYRQLAPTGHYLTPLDLAPPYMKKLSQQMTDQQAAQRNIRLLTADPNTSTRLVATDTTLTAFTFDYTDPIYRPGLAMTLPRRLRYLEARHYDLKDPWNPTEQFSFDGVSVDENNELQLYDLSAGSLTVDSGLSAEANQAVAAGLGGNIIAGLAVADIDQDGYPDIVLALQDPATKQTQEIGWLRYVGQGKFAPLGVTTRARLAGSPLQDVRSLAVGDLNGDGRLDVALATPNSVQVYLNRSK